MNRLAMKHTCLSFAMTTLHTYIATIALCQNFYGGTSMAWTLARTWTNAPLSFTYKMHFRLKNQEFPVDFCRYIFNYSIFEVPPRKGNEPGLPIRYSDHTFWVLTPQIFSVRTEILFDHTDLREDAKNDLKKFSSRWLNPPKIVLFWDLTHPNNLSQYAAHTIYKA